jgi:hypothetical protein
LAAPVRAYKRMGNDTVPLRLVRPPFSEKVIAGVRSVTRSLCGPELLGTTLTLSVNVSCNPMEGTTRHDCACAGVAKNAGAITNKAILFSPKRAPRGSMRSIEGDADDSQRAGFR